MSSKTFKQYQKQSERPHGLGGLQCDHIQTHKVNTYLITYIFGSINDKLSLQHHDLVLQWYFIKVHSHLVLGILVLESPNTMLLI